MTMWPREGNSWSATLQMRVRFWRVLMLQSRRGFLIGAGSLLTTAFVKDVRSFIHRTSQPLLASPSQVLQTLHWYAGHGEDDMGCRLTLGPWMFPPPPPTWREFFVSEVIPHQTDKEIEKTCS